MTVQIMSDAQGNSSSSKGGASRIDEAPVSDWNVCEGNFFQVRGADYLETSKKVESDESLYECYEVKSLRSDEGIICSEDIMVGMEREGKLDEKYSESILLKFDY